MLAENLRHGGSLAVRQEAVQEVADEVHGHAQQVAGGLIWNGAFFPIRPALIGNLQPRNYDAFYIGYNADGHIGRLNLSASAYALFGSDRANVFTGENARIEAFFAAIEPSYDFNWVRLRGAARSLELGTDPDLDSARGLVDTVRDVLAGQVEAEPHRPGAGLAGVAGAVGGVRSAVVDGSSFLHPFRAMCSPILADTLS